MPSNLNALLIAWASSLILVIGGVLLLEATYSPEKVAEQATEQAPDTEMASATDGEDQTAGIQATVTTTSHSPAEPALTAPGQALNTENTVVDTASIPQGIPVQPLTALMEESQFGPLPTVSADGRRSFDVYSVPHIRGQARFRIALLITELGKRARQTQRAVDMLPKEVGLAFSVYGSDLHTWGQKARADGHEVFLSIPMEPVNAQQNDAGPLTLMTGQSRRLRETMLRTNLGKFTGYVGVVNFMGSRFTAAPDSIRPVLDELKRRGLMFIDNRDSKFSRAASMAAGINMPWALNNGYIDDELDAAFIAVQLEKLEQRARAQGTALGIGRPYPVTYRTIEVWAEGLAAKGIELVPVTSIASQQLLPR